MGYKLQNLPQPPSEEDSNKIITSSMHYVNSISEESLNYLLCAVTPSIRNFYNMQAEAINEGQLNFNNKLDCIKYFRKRMSLVNNYTIHSSALDAICHRLVRAYFNEYKNGKHIRTIKDGRFISLEYPGKVVKRIDDNHIVLPAGKNGKNMNIKVSGTIPDKYKQVVLFRKDNIFKINFIHDKKVIQSSNVNVVAIDIGKKHLITTDNGIKVDGISNEINYYNKKSNYLKKMMNKTKNNPKKNKKYREALDRLTCKFENKTQYLLNCKAKEFLTNANASTIVIGDMSDKTFKNSKFMKIFVHKAHLMGIKVYIADEHNTTNICSKCGHIHNMEITDRIFKCSKCGLEIDRDINSAINIKQRFIARSEPSSDGCKSVVEIQQRQYCGKRVMYAGCSKEKNGKCWEPVIR